MNDSVPLFLVVDDNLINIQLLGAMLAKAGFRVAVAKSGEEALKRLEVIRPTMIFMDIKMPIMSGFECCRLIKADPAKANIPIVFLSADDDESTINKAKAAGGCDYLVKPVERMHLLSIIKDQLAIE